MPKPVAIPFMDLERFQSEGYLQEVNRQFFHPLGMALTLVTSDDGSPAHLQVLDDRGDLEGWLFTTDDHDDMARKALAVTREINKRRPVREKALGFWKQPLPKVATKEGE